LPDGRGSYRVTYWDEGWQSVLFGSERALVDQFIAEGFDGVFLDHSDALARDGGSEAAAQELAGLVTRLTTHARRINPEFIVALRFEPTLERSSIVTRVVDGIVSPRSPGVVERSVSGTPVRAASKSNGLPAIDGAVEFHVIRRDLTQTKVTATAD
jgi:hypothetical protein